MNHDSHIDADLQALRRTTSRDLPGMAETRRRLADDGRRSRGALAAMLTILKSRPKTTVLLGTAVLAAALVVIPIPYSRTVGYEVAIDLDAGRETADKIAGELARTLKTRETKVQARPGGYRVTARARGASERTASATSAAFVDNLTARGVKARGGVAPMVARVTGNVYAMARDQIVRLEIDEDTSPEEIARHVRQQLDLAGVEAGVDVYEHEGQTIVTVTPEDPNAMTRFEVNGETVDLDGEAIPSALQQIRIERTPGMTDEELARQIEAKLAEAGVTADVKIVDGKILVLPSSQTELR